MHPIHCFRSAALGLAIALAACSSSRTELIVGVATDLRATEQLDGVDLAVTRIDDGAPIVQTHFAISGQAGALDNLPGSYGIYSDGAETRLDIVLSGTKAGTEVVRRHAVVNLVEGKTLFYRLGLTASCMSMADCPDQQTCSEGTCVGLRINSEQFPEFGDGLVDTLTCAGGTSYVDTANGNAPMPFAATAGECAPGLCREGTCLTPPPSCSSGEATNRCNEAVTACNAGCNTTTCAFNLPGGAQGCEQISTLDDACLAAVCALSACAGSPEAGWGGSGGACGLLGCDFEGAAVSAACGNAARTAPELAPYAAMTRAITAAGSR